jgi:TonB-linked SusC/RagA family outer membrane protein
MKKIKRILILCFCAFFSFSVAFSQQKFIIRGRVIDKSDKSVVIGANIVEYDKDNRVINGTICNTSGDFSLEIKDIKHKVSVSFIGYVSKEIIIDLAKPIIVELEPAVHKVDEVIVTSYARRRGLTNLDDRDKASASVKVDLMDMKESGALSVADALQGRVSGLDILSAGGDPGSGARIVIRGLASMGNSKPLIVIDGVPQSSPPNYDQFNLGSANIEDIGTLISVPVQDIKSVEVLKDGAATAAYGSKGADGVLLIETHKGKKGKVILDYTYKNSLNFQPPAIPMLNGDEYIMMQREELHNKYGSYIMHDGISYNRASSDFFNYSQNTDWIGALTKQGNTDDHYISVQGGGEKASYFTSLSYINEGGTTINTGSKNFSTRVKFGYQLSEKMRFEIVLNYVNISNNYNYNVQVNSWSTRGVREMAYIKAPNMSIWEYDANGNLTGNYFNPIESYQAKGDDYFNPVAVANLGKNDQIQNKLANSFSVFYNIASWLTLQESVTLDLQGEKINTFLPYNALGQDWIGPKVNMSHEGNSIYQNFKTHTQLYFNVPFTNKKHEVSGAFTWNTEQERSENMYVQGSKTPSVPVQDPSVNSQVDRMGSGSYEKRYLQGVLSLNYILNDKYSLQTVLTDDAHTAFGTNNNWGLFVGISGYWRFGKENFLKGLSFLGQDSKIRASWGNAGRPPSDNTYVRFATYASPGDGVPSSYMGNTAIVPTQIQLDNLRWETTTSTNLGADLFLFKDRLYIQAEMYRKMTSDIANGYYNIPKSSGFYNLGVYNGGQMLNKGWEVSIDYKFIQRQDFMVSLGFNISQNENSFVKFPNNFKNENSTELGNGKYPKILVEGSPIGSFYGFRFKGVYAYDADAVAKDAAGNTMYDNNGAPVPMKYKDSYVFRGGDAIYEDINHDGTIDLNDVVYLGNSNPRFYGGFNPSVRYKNFTFRADFQYRVGADIVNMIALQTQGMNDKNNQSKAVLRRWRVQGQNEPDILPRAYFEHPANNLGSDRYVEKGDFLRLVNVMASYKIGPKLCNKLHVRTMSITLSARKIYTLTNYSGQDPEVGGNAKDPFWIGADYSRTPPPQIATCAFTIGL